MRPNPDHWSGRLLLALLALTGCAHRPINPPLAEAGAKTGYTFQAQARPNNSPEILFVLAFSGGGTRAAALGYGVLQELERTTYPMNGQPRRVIDEVDAISAVSGGSFAAAAYGLYGDEFFKTFPEAFLKRDVQEQLVWKTLNPFRWPALMSGDWGRSDMAAAYYDKILFTNATYADLQKRPGPFIVINATDITSGMRFSFTQQRFDYLCSDLSAYPLSRACAASSAVPGVLSPITLNNYAGTCGFSPPSWVTNREATLSGNARLLARALQLNLDRTNHPYLHLVDGGVSDNLGLHELLDDVAYIQLTPELRQQHDISKLKKVVIISANAYSSPQRDWDMKESPPGSIATAVAAASHTLDRVSYDTLEAIKGSVEDWQKEFSGKDQIKFYSVLINFTNFKDLNDRRFFLNLPTSFVLPPTDVDKLVDAGSRLLRQNKTYQDFLSDLGAQVTSPLPSATSAPETKNGAKL